MVKLCDFGGAFLLAHSDPGGIMTGAREATCSDCIAGERPFGIECDFKSSLWRGGGGGEAASAFCTDSLTHCLLCGAPGYSINEDHSLAKTAVGTPGYTGAAC